MYCLILLFKDVFTARKNFLYTKTVVNDGYGVAFDVLGAGPADDLMSDQERRRLEEARRKRAYDSGPWTGATAGARRGNLLNMVAAGNKKPKRDRTNAPCFE